MKKLMSAALIAAALATGVAFAQDAEEEAPKAEWNVSGHLTTGFNANFSDMTLRMGQYDYSGNCLQLDASYSYGNVGVDGRLRFISGAQWGNTASTTIATEEQEDGTKVVVKDSTYTDYAAYDTALTFGLKTPQLVYGYAYADLLDDALHFEIGRLYANPVGPNFYGYGCYGNGASVTYTTPVEGLTVAAIVYVPGTKYTSSISADFWKDSMFYGASYSSDFFAVSAGFGYESLAAQTGALLTTVQLAPVDQFSLYAETDVFGLLDGAPYLEGYGEIDLSVYDPLALSLYYSVNYNLAKGNLDIFEAELESHYTVSDNVKANFYAGVCNDGTFFVLPGVSYVMGHRTSISAYYNYGTAVANLSKSAFSTGNAVVVEFSLKF